MNSYILTENEVLPQSNENNIAGIISAFPSNGKQTFWTSLQDNNNRDLHQKDKPINAIFKINLIVYNKPNSRSITFFTKKDDTPKILVNELIKNNIINRIIKVNDYKQLLQAFIHFFSDPRHSTHNFELNGKKCILKLMSYSTENKTPNLVPNPEYGGNVTEILPPKQHNPIGGRVGYNMEPAHFNEDAIIPASPTATTTATDLTNFNLNPTNGGGGGGGIYRGEPSFMMTKSVNLNLGGRFKSLKRPFKKRNSTMQQQNANNYLKLQAKLLENKHVRPNNLRKSKKSPFRRKLYQMPKKELQNANNLRLQAYKNNLQKELYTNLQKDKCKGNTCAECLTPVRIGWHRYRERDCVFDYKKKKCLKRFEGKKASTSKLRRKKSPIGYSIDRNPPHLMTQFSIINPKFITKHEDCKHLTHNLKKSKMFTDSYWVKKSPNNKMIEILPNHLNINGSRIKRY